MTSTGKTKRSCKSFLHYIRKRPLAGALAAAGLLLAGPALAINGSGNWSLNAPFTSQTSVTGTFITPQGDSGEFKLERNSASGYRPFVGFATQNQASDNIYSNPNGLAKIEKGLVAQNYSCSPSCTDGDDSFTFTLELTPTKPTTNPAVNTANIRLVTEVVQGQPISTRDNSMFGNSEAAQMTLYFEGTGVLAVNDAVKLDPTNGANWAALTVRQVRTYNTTGGPTYNVADPSLWPELTTPAIRDASSVQLFGVHNKDSKYRIDLLNSKGVILKYKANMIGNPGSSTTVGETFQEWIGFGVRSLPLAALDSFAVTNTTTTTTASVLVNDYVGGISVVTCDLPSCRFTAGEPVMTPGGQITMNADGTITIPAGTTPGTYEISYELCDMRAAESSCVKAVATIIVSPPATAVPVGPWWLLLPPMLVAGGWSLRRRREQR